MLNISNISEIIITKQKIYLLYTYDLKALF
jgi:hypothetical protein